MSPAERAAEAALAYLPGGEVIGVGTGSTVESFIAALGPYRGRIAGAVSSSDRTTEALQKAGIAVVGPSADIGVYIDGADAYTPQGYLIKGRGGALAREKVLAAMAGRFVCVVDESKAVSVLGRSCPVPVEVLEIARSYVSRVLTGWGGSVVYRAGYLTDNGNPVVDVGSWDILDPVDWESRINQIPGVVSHGIFAIHRPERILIGTADGVGVLVPRET